MPKTKTTGKKRGRPKKDPSEPKFRFKGKKIGLTYSCPKNARDNPIKNNEELLELLTDRWGLSRYIIAEEIHTDPESPGFGKRHYHVYMHLDACLDKTKPSFADVDFTDARPFKHVHPNILKNETDGKPTPPGPGWMNYCKKDKKYITNIEVDAWTRALSQGSARDAAEFLWINKPADMCKHGTQIEANLAKRYKATRKPAILYDGPYPKHYFPDVDMEKYSICFWGPKDTNKTQFARYLMSHSYGKYGFAKGGIDSMKSIDTGMPFIFDEVNMHLPRFNPDDSREITCVEGGGTVTARNTDIEIPPGVPRIFTANMKFPFKNPAEAVYGRRVIMHEIPAFDEENPYVPPVHVTPPEMVVEPAPFSRVVSDLPLEFISCDHLNY